MKQYALEMFIIGMMTLSLIILFVPMVTAFFQRRAAAFKDWWFLYHLRHELRKKHRLHH